MTTHHLTIPLMQWQYLIHGDKHFLTIPDTEPPLHYGDVLIMHAKYDPEKTLTRWVSYLESGVGYTPNWVCVELAP